MLCEDDAGSGNLYDTQGAENLALYRYIMPANDGYLLQPDPAFPSPIMLQVLGSCSKTSHLQAVCQPAAWDRDLPDSN